VIERNSSKARGILQMLDNDRRGQKRGMDMREKRIIRQDCEERGKIGSGRGCGHAAMRI